MVPVPGQPLAVVTLTLKVMVDVPAGIVATGVAEVVLLKVTPAVGELHTYDVAVPPVTLADNEIVPFVNSVAVFGIIFTVSGGQTIWQPTPALA
jgi:hypothetical protein